MRLGVIKVDIKADIAQAKRSLGMLERDVNKAAGRALNRVATTTRKNANQTIRQRLNLNSRVVKAGLLIRTPMVGGKRSLVRDIQASGRPIPIRDYGAKGTRRGVTYAVKRGSRKLYSRGAYKGFIIDKYGRHVFTRIEPDPPGPAKARVKKAYGPSLPQYFVTRAVIAAMRLTVRERWPIEFRRAIEGIRLRKR